MDYKEILTISPESFASYGDVIEFQLPVTGDPYFEVICGSSSEGWRIALYRVERRSVDSLECHPGSMESFEPVSGTGILLVASPENPEGYKAFLLDRPVCLKKGIWHQLISLGGPCVVKIMENDEVFSEIHQLSRPLRAVLQTGSKE